MFSNFEFFESNWDSSEHEYQFLGACCEYFSRRATHEKLLKLLATGVDETWFLNEKTRALYIGVLQASLLIGKDSSTIVGNGAIVDKAESWLEEQTPGSVGFCNPLIKKCKESISYFDIKDFIDVDLEVWYHKLKKYEVRSLATSVVNATNSEFTKETNEEIVSLIQKQEDIWTSTPGQIKSDRGLFSSVRDSVLKPRPEESTISTGLKVLDFCLGGGLSGPESMEEGKLITLMARPGMGKTLLASSVAMRVCQANHKCAFWSLEMKDKQIALRVLAGLDYDKFGKDCNDFQERITYEKLRSHELSESQKERLTSNDYSVLDENLSIYNGGSDLTVESLTQRMKLIAKREPETTLFILDHLHLLKLPAGNEVTAIGEITRMLKTTAVEVGIDILLLCQCNRANENRNDKRVTLQDARGSGRIEEDSDVVMSLFRPHYYDSSEDPEKLEIRILKNRQGQSGDFPARVSLNCCNVHDAA